METMMTFDSRRSWRTFGRSSSAEQVGRARAADADVVGAARADAAAAQFLVETSGDAEAALVACAAGEGIAEDDRRDLATTDDRRGRRRPAASTGAPVSPRR